MVFAAYSCSSSSPVSSSMSAMPMMPFIGVRISWLIVARNSDLVRLAASARSRAVSRLCRCARIRLAISRVISVPQTMAHRPPNTTAKSVARSVSNPARPAIGVST